MNTTLDNQIHCVCTAAVDDSTFLLCATAAVAAAVVTAVVVTLLVASTKTLIHKWIMNGMTMKKHLSLYA